MCIILNARVVIIFLVGFCTWKFLFFVALCVSTKKPSGPEVACTFAKSTGGAGQSSAPIISVPTQTRTSMNGLGASSHEHESTASSFTDQPIFFRCVSMPLFVVIFIKCLMCVAITQSLLTMLYMLVFTFLFQRVQVHFWGANSTRLSWKTYGHGAGGLSTSTTFITFLWNCFSWDFSRVYDYTYTENIIQIL